MEVVIVVTNYNFGTILKAKHEISTIEEKNLLNMKWNTTNLQVIFHSGTESERIRKDLQIRELFMEPFMDFHSN